MISYESLSDDYKLFLQEAESLILQSATRTEFIDPVATRLQHITSAFCNREHTVIDKLSRNTDALNSLQSNFLFLSVLRLQPHRCLLRYSTLMNSMIRSQCHINFTPASTSLSSYDRIYRRSTQDACVIIDCQLPKDNFCLFKQVHQSTSWVQLRLTVNMDSYDVSHTYSAHANANLAHMLNSDILIHCAQL